MVEIADHHARLQKKLRASDHDIPVCRVNYRPPDVTLGSQRFQEVFDMWSFGCVAAELYSHLMLTWPSEYPLLLLHFLLLFIIFLLFLLLFPLLLAQIILRSTWVGGVWS